jgi:3-hydroxyacyl-CoA dehydrogenase/enoyl-CoA hydratase/3-hydroxybutyryl-CoA epimerase
MTKNPYRNWYIVEEENISWLYFNKAESSTNVLSAEVLDELEAVLKYLSGMQPKGLVILSAKQNGFIAGADIEEFTKLKDHSEAEGLIRRGQSVFNLLEKLPFPTVSLIHGFCLGGGLELALACRYRVAKDDIRTRLGLPEVKLGIHPGFGGTVRLPKLVGAPAAMDLILSGKTIDAHKAKKIGLVDAIVTERHLKDMAVKCISDKPPAHSPSTVLKLTNHSLVRPLLKKVIVSKTEKKVNQKHYPAPFAAIDLWARFADNSQAMLSEEARSVARLITGTTAQNLIRVFFLSNRLKSLGKARDFSASHVHVIGAGTMGGDIAAWCALQGFHVTLQARKPESIALAIKRAYKLFKKRVVRPRLVRNTMDRLMPDIRGTGLKKADVIIEAVFEDAEVKRNIYKDIEPHIKQDALLATNTSSIPLEELATALSRPERLVGLHFFNPVAKMPLVEVVAGESTDPNEIKRALAFTKGIDRLPLPVKSSPGFLVNRILMPYLLEAVLIVEEGVMPSVIDRAATDFGMPMGPVLLADTVGLDICLHAAETMSEKYGIRIPDILYKKVKDGLIGKKSGRGFYTYKDGKQLMAQASADTVSPGSIQERLVLRIVNESVACLDEGIVEDSDLLDAAMVFGTGFAPFRGGVIQHCRSVGFEKSLDQLRSLEARFGDRFSPAKGWDSIEKTVRTA